MTYKIGHHFFPYQSQRSNNHRYFQCKVKSLIRRDSKKKKNLQDYCFIPATFFQYIFSLLEDVYLIKYIYWSKEKNACRYVHDITPVLYIECL